MTVVRWTLGQALNMGRDGGGRDDRRQLGVRTRFAITAGKTNGRARQA
jgi:hypothetical protein